MEANKIVGYGFEYTFTEKGDWLYKALPVRKLQVQEKPQIKVCNDIEEAYHKFWGNQLAHIVKDISRYLSG